MVIFFFWLPSRTAKWLGIGNQCRERQPPPPADHLEDWARGAIEWYPFALGKSKVKRQSAIFLVKTEPSASSPPNCFLRCPKSQVSCLLWKGGGEMVFRRAILVVMPHVKIRATQSSTCVTLVSTQAQMFEGFAPPINLSQVFKPFEPQLKPG